MEVSGRKGHIVCEPCAEDGDDITADGCCKECEENMCSKCFQHHRKGKHCRNHVFLYAYCGSPSALKIKPVGLIDKCPKHVEEKINFYCEAHEIVGCGECIIHEHKTCEVLYISDVTRGQNEHEYIEEVVKEIENCSNEIKEYEKEIHRNIAKMKAAHVKFTCDAERFKQEILEKIDKLIFDACKQASFIKTDTLSALGKLKVEVSNITDELSSMKTKAGMEKNEPTGNFVMALWLRKRLKEIEEDLIEIGKRTIGTKYRFLKNENIEQEVEKCKGRDLYLRGPDDELDKYGIRNPRTVILEKASGVFGLTIKGGGDKQLLFVHKVVPGTPAANSNKILLGDNIISINNVDVTKASHREAVSLMKKSEKTILLLCRPEDFNAKK
ncbi:E3 ubiquitin-protein ligase TRIM45-like [Ruditapes philippinarum]|uniref:E3 ubiquitin-protein ligase TRIM45-like n=1 Tax=Ruditapes philippinarum TaxID=129788 RepID=UPI00295BB9D8|nr:E3 ubiquitin-protein ligase TRIM45-like [Ruditapes philippinarum]